MKAAKVREMSDVELQAEARKLEEQLFKLRIQKVTAQLENPQKTKLVRRDIARIKTVLRERAGAEAPKTRTSKPGKGD